MHFKYPQFNARSDKVKLADSILAETGLMSGLRTYEACVVSTVHAGIDIEDSDIDIVCCYRSQSDFVSSFRKLHYIRHINIAEEYITGRFTRKGLEFEVYASAIPVKDQSAYRHYSVMLRLVSLGGAQFQTAVRNLKKQGLKTEPAIAHYLNLDGDSYESVLELYLQTDKILNEMLANARK